MTQFSETAWQRNESLYQAMLTMPFNQALADGTLSRDIFKYYMIQDAHYLEGFSRVLAIAATKCTLPADVILFLDSAKEALVVEQALHKAYFQQFEISEKSWRNTPASPECELYMSYLAKLALFSPYEVLLAALLPCFWVYLEIGKAIHQIASLDNPYHAWIETYASDAFDESVNNVIKTINQIAATTSTETQNAMHHAFKRAMQLEWLFWDSAYHRRTWPMD